MNHVANNLNHILHDIAACCQKRGSEAGICRLVGVSKTFTAEDITPALIAGQRIFGENRVQEAKAKWPDLRTQFPDIELHLIGPLQSNKAGEAVALFDVIQSVDREKIALALAKEMEKQQRNLPIFIQVNIGNEPQKAGIKAEELSDFVSFCSQECHFQIKGLMCIPPFDEDPTPYFQQMKGLKDMLQFQELSMGMSGDFQTAIQHGATYVRVGSALFGKRIYAK